MINYLSLIKYFFWSKIQKNSLSNMVGNEGENYGAGSF